MKWVGAKRQEYISKFIGDIAKTIFAVGLASGFFKEMPGNLRIVLAIVSLVLMIVSIWFHPRD